MKETKIFYALDKNRDPIDIKTAKHGDTCYCIGCGQELVIKAEKSTRVQKYFSHLPGEECSYAENHDMSEWHYMWQTKFPGCCEVPMPNKSNPVHRADVCIWGRVIEFQHSPISEEEFRSRNDFYPTQMREIDFMGRNYIVPCSLAWIFDMNGHVNRIDKKSIKLKKRNDLFKGYDINVSGYALFFEFEEKLYRVSHMDDSTGLYYLTEGEGINKDDFVSAMKYPPIITPRKSNSQVGISNGYKKQTSLSCLPGYRKAVRNGYNKRSGCF